MSDEATSRHLKGATELTLVADIKPGLVDVRETLSYATRLRVLLQVLYTLRKTSVETEAGMFVGPLERLQTLHFVRWTILDNRQLMLAVTFDGAWEPYMRTIVEVAGPLLDVILCNCVDFDAHASDHGYEKFVEWVREHQVDTQFFHAGFPDTTVDDVRYLKELEARQIADPNGLDEALARFRVANLATESEPPQEKDIPRLLDGLYALFRLRKYYPESDVLHHHKYLLRTAHLMFGHILDDLSASDERKPHVRWLRSLQLEREPRPPGRGLSAEEEKTVQGNILDSNQYDGVTHGCLLFMRIRERLDARQFLLDQIPRLESTARGDVRMNLSFTYPGLRALGMPAADLAKLPKEFRDGMGARAGLLGDVGPNHPSQWQPPRRNYPAGTEGPPLDLSTIDFVIQLQVRSEIVEGDHVFGERHPLFAEVNAIASQPGVELLAVDVQRTHIDEHGHVYEHFGWRDGISQPNPRAAEGEVDHVPLGELLLGHPNARDDEGRVALECLRNGSFVVIRKLEQDVAAFLEVIEGDGRSEADQRELMGKMMGRYPSGVPVHDESIDADDNDWTFGGPEGCPYDAHIRRTNPRTPRPERSVAGTRPAPVPRIMRRGFSYGLRYDEDRDTTDRGLLFIAYNASIAEQFEIVQGWVAGSNSTGVLSDHSDPVLGLPSPDRARWFRYAKGEGEDPVRVALGDKPFVTLKWGLYLFAPSTEGLAMLADLLQSERRREPFDVLRGRQVIARLEQVEPFLPDDVAVLEWKKLLEDVALREVSKDVWAAIRAGDGALRTPYGVLLAGRREVMTAFAKPDLFSVREYWDRMQQSIGALYLGMDPKPAPMDDRANAHAREQDPRYRVDVDEWRYYEESKEANAWIAAIDESDAFRLAQLVTSKWLNHLTEDGTEEQRFPIHRFIGDVLAGLSQLWFVLPDDDFMQRGGEVTSKAHCPDNFLATARYIFSPNPTDFVVNEGREKGQALLAAAREVVAKAVNEGNRHRGTLFAHLAPDEIPLCDLDQDLMARALVGSVHGFVGPCYGTLFSTMYGWVSTGALWRLQQSLEWEMRDSGGELDEAVANRALRRSLIAAMQEQPLPYILHRTVMADTELGGVKLVPGDRVVLGLISATHDEPGEVDLLFGGRFESKNAPTHACPGRKLAMGAMLGMLSTLLAYGAIGKVDPRTLSIEPFARSRGG